MSTCTNSLQAEVHTLLLNMYTHTHTHTHTHTYICMYVYRCIHIYIYMCMCVCVTYMYIYVCVCVCVCLYISIYIYTHTYIYIYRCTYMYLYIYVYISLGGSRNCKEGPYQDRPPLCPFRLLPLLIYSGSTIAFLKILKVQGPKSKKIENLILLQPRITTRSHKCSNNPIHNPNQAAGFRSAHRSSHGGGHVQELHQGRKP